MLPSPWPDMLKRHSNCSHTRPPNTRKTPLIHGPNWNTAQPFNTWNQKTPPTTQQIRSPTLTGNGGYVPLLHTRAVDNTTQVALGTIAAAQTHVTDITIDAVVYLLNYTATHPDAAIRFYKSAMQLYVYSDASYRSEPNARSRVGGYFYLGNNNEPPDKLKPKGAVHIESRIMKNATAAASEAEVGALFHNGQQAAHMRNIF